MPNTGVRYSEMKRALSLDELNSKTGIDKTILEKALSSLSLKGYITVCFLIGKDFPHYLLTEKGRKALFNNKFLWINVWIVILGPLLLLVTGLFLIKWL